MFGANRRDESVHAQHAAVLERMNDPFTYYELHDDREDGLEAAQVCQVGFMLYARHKSEFNIMMSLFDD